MIYKITDIQFKVSKCLQYFSVYKSPNTDIFINKKRKKKNIKRTCRRFQVVCPHSYTLLSKSHIHSHTQTHRHSHTHTHRHTRTHTSIPVHQNKNISSEIKLTFSYTANVLLTVSHLSKNQYSPFSFFPISLPAIYFITTNTR